MSDTNDCAVALLLLSVLACQLGITPLSKQSDIWIDQESVPGWAFISNAFETHVAYKLPPHYDTRVAEPMTVRIYEGSLNGDMSGLIDFGHAEVRGFVPDGFIQALRRRTGNATIRTTQQIAGLPRIQRMAVTTN